MNNKTTKNYPAPANSADHTFLIKELVKNSQKGLTKEQVRDFLWKTNAPGELRSLPRICGNIKSALVSISQSQLFTDLKEEYSTWINICDEVVRNQASLENKIGAHFNKAPQKEGAHPYRKWGFERFPLFSSVWNIQQNPRAQDAYQFLQGCVLLAHTQWVDKHISQYSYQNYSPEEESILPYRIYHACNALRRWSRVEHSNAINAFVSDIKIKTNSLDDLMELMEVLTDPEMPVKAGDFKTLLSMAFDPKFKIRTGNDNPNPGTGNPEGVFTETGYVDFSDETYLEIYGNLFGEDPWSEPPIKFKRKPNHSETETIEITDLHPDEVIDDDEECVIFNHQCSTKSLSLKARALAAKGRARAESIQNQFLPNTWGKLTIWEVATLIKYCSSRLDNLKQKFPEVTDFDDEIIIEAETLLFILCLLITGRPISQIHFCLVRYSFADISPEVTFLVHEQSWLVKPYEIDYKTEISSVQREFTKQLSQYIILPDTFGISNYVEAVFNTVVRTKIKGKASGESSKFHSDRLFLRPLKTYKSKIKKIFNCLPEGHRASLHNIEKFIFQHMVCDCNFDLPECMLITGQENTTGKIHLHYTTIDLNTLAQRYHDVTQSLIEKVNLENYGQACRNKAVSLPKQEGFVGSRLCPTNSFLHKTIHHLDNHLHYNFLFNADWRDRHNLFTVYTLMMQGYSTGYREVGNPYIMDEKLFRLKSSNNKEYHLAPITDKGSNKTRIAFLTTSANQQMHEYLFHRKKVIAHLHKSNRKLHKECQGKEFFLLIDNEVQVIRPKHFKQIIEDFFPLPLNVNRRYIRTRLIEMNNPPEIINIFMGHWTRGSEPFGDFSSLPLLDAFEQISPALEAINQELGWAKIEAKEVTA
jgi:hypothetical protein